MGISSSSYEESMSAKGGSFGAAGGSFGAAGGSFGAAAAAGDNLVQIKPQRVKLQLRQSKYLLSL